MRWPSMLLLLSACSRSPAEKAPVTVPPATPPASAEGPAKPPTRSEGLPKPPEIRPVVYVGAPCLGRTYERVVTLGPDDKIEIADRVAPCPPGAACVWSGIVVRSGTYAAEPGKGSTRLILSIDAPDSGQARPLPPTLSWWSSRGELTEPGESCSYVRQP
ncbi:MAG: hypothetical protein KC776_43545 [Myxococcales bacterium]|nr:hypothetical protein [Myxococcales bacterium]